VATGLEPADIEKALDQRLEQLSKKFGITSDDKYRALLLTVLAAMGVKGFQVVDELPKRAGGAPVVWTLRRHAALVGLVNKRIGEGDTQERAIEHARKMFAKELSNPNLKVRAEYFRAKRFIKSAPHVVPAMLSKQKGSTGQAFADFVQHGATVTTRHRKQLIAADHLVEPKRKRSPSALRIDQQIAQPESATFGRKTQPSVLTDTPSWLDSDALTTKEM
jgi:hypothetical protein